MANGKAMTRARPAPRGRPARCTRRGPLRGDHDAGVGGETPELVVRGIERRSIAARHRDRCVAYVDDDRAPVEHRAKFRGCCGRVEHWNVRNREESSGKGVAPVFVEPTIESVEDRGACFGIAGEGLLDADREGGKQHHPAQTLRVDGLQARSRSWYSGRSGSSSPNASRIPTCSGFPRYQSKSAPGRETGSKVGFAT